MPRASRACLNGSASQPATSNVTIAQSSGPRSSTRTPSISDSPARSSARERRRAVGDRLHPDVEGVADRRRGSEQCCVRKLPVLEACCGRDRLVRIRLRPACAAHVDEQRLVAGGERAVRRRRGPRFHAGRAGTCRHVADRKSQPSAVDVEVVLADRLACVDEIEQVELAATLADLLDRLHEAGVGRDVGGDHEARPHGLRSARPSRRRRLRPPARPARARASIPKRSRREKKAIWFEM